MEQIADTSRSDHGDQVVGIAGTLDKRTGQSLIESFRSMEFTGHACCLDLGRADAIDEDGFKALVAADRILRARGVDLVLLNPPRELLALLTLADLSDRSREIRGAATPGSVPAAGQ